MGDAVVEVAAAVEAAVAAEEVEVEAVEVEAAAADTEATVEEMEEGAEAKVRVAPALELEEPEVTRGCGCAMNIVYPPCPFRMGKNFTLLLQRQSSPRFRVTSYTITGTYAECSGRTVIVKALLVPTSHDVAEAINGLSKTVRC